MGIKETTIHKMSSSHLSLTATAQTCTRVISIALLLLCSAEGQARPSTVNDVLKDVKPAPGICRADDVMQANLITSIHSERAITADMTCAISPSELSSIISIPETAVVDVRTKVEQLGSYFDSALNMPISELRTKTFLKNKTIVLIGNGKAERELYAACSELKTLGFKQVKVAHGGMPSWLHYRQAIVERRPERVQPTRLTASELWIESQFESNLVLIVRKQESMKRQFIFSTLIPDENPVVVQNVIERRRKELKNLPLAAVVLVAAPDLNVEAIERLRYKIQPTPLLIYADTEEAYARYLAQQKAIWAAQARGPKQPGCGL